jgi:2'-5' RNA ligase
VIRAFVALPVDAATDAGLDAVARRLAQASGDAVRWLGSGGFHLTLKFLGETPEATLEAVRAALGPAAAEHPAPSLGVEGLGTFPPRGPVRVIWAGLGGDLEALAALAAAIESACGSCGFPRERRPFRAHVTLGRVRRGRRVPTSLHDALGEELRLPPFRATEVILFRSLLRPEGARYEGLARFPLAAPEGS